MSFIRVAGIIKESVVDGPGIRYTIFTQGCLHNCFNCHNPKTHSLDGGYLISIDEIINDLLLNPLLSGVTISGGEPFLQKEALLQLIVEIRNNTGLNILVYTGFRYEQLLETNLDILEKIDILIDGLFINHLKDLELLFMGSSNQRMIDVVKSLTENRIIEI